MGRPLAMMLTALLPFPALMSLVFACGVMSAGLSAQSSPTVAGMWQLQLDPGFDDAPKSVACEISQTGRDLVLECDELEPSAGTLDDLSVKFVVMTGKDHLLPARFSGTLDASGDAIVGTWRLEDTTGNRIGRFRASRR